MKKIAFTVSVALALGVEAWYATYGYSSILPFLLIAAGVVTAFSLPRATLTHEEIHGAIVKFNRIDVYILIGLLALFIPFYTFRTLDIPLQINTDEITIPIFFKYISGLKNPDLFGLSGYFGFPTFIFAVFGWLGRAIGGIELGNMRLIHGISGIIIIIVSYLFFRNRRGPYTAAVATFFMAASHSLVALSRTAMRDNTSLLFEVAAMLFLIRGVMQRSLTSTFIGGLIAGLTFYTYYPSRITMPLWAVFLGAYWLIYRPRKLKHGASPHREQATQHDGMNFKQVLTYGALSVLGFLFIAGPVLIATLKDNGQATNFQREQSILFPEGRQKEMEWSFTNSIEEAVKTNIKNGLTVFNNKVSDQSFIYPNFNHGFIDPLSGWLLWLGMVVVLIRLWRGRKKADGDLSFDLLMVTSFFMIYLVLSFVVNKAPNYTRLLIILPFFAYIASEGLMIAGGSLSWLSKKILKEGAARMTKVIAVGAGLAVIGYLNFQIYADFVDTGVREGNDVGSTARYVLARREIPAYSFYLVADKQHMYYYWGEDWQWKSWIEEFSDLKRGQITKVIPLPNFIAALPTAPFTIFMNQQVWQESQTQLLKLHPSGVLTNIKTDGSLVALEVN